MSVFSVNRVIEWHGSEVIDPKLEQVVGINNFQQPWFLSKGLERSKAVGLIPGKKGTGFLISENLIMTNWHVLRKKSWAEGESILFDFEQAEDGMPTTPNKVLLDPDVFFYSNENLDVAVVGVQGNPGSTRGWIDIKNPGSLFEDSRVNIVQHPGAGFKKIAIRENGLKQFEGNTLQYWTDTEHGSSGSPLFDDHWDIIGLHYRHDSASTPSGVKIYYNEGHQITAILDVLERDNPGFSLNL